jgi:hypothetical protein
MHEDHIHAGHDDDAEQKREEEPEVFRVGHVSYPFVQKGFHLAQRWFFKRLPM